jgi:hypothetical protein
VAKSLKDELDRVSRDLRDHSDAMRIEWLRAMNEGHAWTDPEHNDFVAAFEASSKWFLQLLEEKRRLQREIHASKTP